ncbi:uroporphyrinogen-III synthase [Symmachiella dynata]|uniref:uroporphyrinogen-III synthase n=1 Tax=Symmachiella dynata TaxID=2527995 RepID=UPI0030EC9647
MAESSESETHHPASFQSLRVCSFESRKGNEMRSLIERHGGLATIAPSMQEVPLGENPEALQFAEELFAGQIDMIAFMTGVGAKALLAAIETRYPREKFLDALRQTHCIVRGPKPAAVFRSWKVPFAGQAPEPNTWRELLTVFDEDLAGKVVAVQEYGRPSTEFYAALEQRGATVRPVTVYQWALPDDTEPLLSAIRATVAGDLDVLMFTSAQQLHNTLEVAETAGLKQDWLDAAANCVIASIGPTASEHLHSVGLPVDLEPDHPKMGHLVRAAAQAAPKILESKRGND